VGWCSRLVNRNLGCCKENIAFKKLAIDDDLQLDLRASQLLLLDRPYITSGQWPVVTSLSSTSTVFEILQLLLAMYVTADDRCPSLSSVKFKSQAISTFWFMYKHIEVKRATFLWVVGIRKGSNSKSDLQAHSRSLLLMSFDRPYMIFY